MTSALEQFNAATTNDTTSRLNGLLALRSHPELVPWVEAADKAGVTFVKDGNRRGTLSAHHTLVRLASRYEMDTLWLERFMVTASQDHVGGKEMARMVKAAVDLGHGVVRP